MDRARFRIRETGSGLEVPVHVQPRAKHSEMSGFYDGALKLKVLAPPVDDAANRAVIEYFSRLLGLPKAQIRIIAGLKSRDKVLLISGVTLEVFQERALAGRQDSRRK